MSQRRLSTAFLIAVLVFSMYSCRKTLYSSIDISDTGPAPGAGVEIDARFLSDPEEIEDLFHSFLPDSGIVPILVGIRNNDTVPLRIHSANSLDLRSEFEGFSLLIGGKEIAPVHPAQVIAMVKGLRRPADYRKYGGKEIATGAVILPLGAFYAWKGFKEYREYRPLIKASLLPAERGGVFRPLRLEPGEEVNGYLYFPLLPSEVPYTSETVQIVRSSRKKTEYLRDLDISLVHDVRLKVKVSAARIEDIPRYQQIVTRDTLELSSGIFCRRDREILSGVLPGKSRRGVFGIRPGSGGTSLVYFDYGEGDFKSPHDGDFVEIKKFGGTSADIADAEVFGQYAGCAVDFKRRSRVFILRNGEAGDNPEIVAVRDYERKAKRIFLYEEGFFVITEDAFCYFEDYTGKKSSYWKLANDFQDAYLLDDGTFLLLGKKGAVLISGNDTGRSRSRVSVSLANADRNICGIIDEDVVFIQRGKGESGDTLVIFDASRLEEKGRMPLGSRAESFGMEGDHILMQLEEGTVIDLEKKSNPEFIINRSAWSESRFVSMTLDGRSFEAITGEGLMLRGRIDQMLPRPVSPGNDTFTTVVGTICAGEGPGSVKGSTR
ncbi:MAG: hypothetical protein JW814_06120 [Candidatus Krumholzibacteriota bacterium]|nr:hypothetical protein [Candidatus Krumholzibacteriota bacterium]